MNTLIQDLKYGIRMLAKNPGFTAVAVITLALGIGANTAIFSFVDAVLLKPLPFPHPERMVMVWEKPPDGGRNVVSTLNFLDWKNQNSVFDAMAAQGGATMTLTGADQPVMLRVGLVSAPYFNIFGAQPLLGRTFAPDEDQLGKQHEAVLSHRIWENRFGADPGLIGRNIALDGESYTVIGVMPPGLFDRSWPDLWAPLAFQPTDLTRDYHWLVSFARLKPGVTLEQARQQMNAIALRIADDYPKSNKGWGATVTRYADTLVDNDLRKTLLVLLAAVGAVLLIGCVNLANLLLVRGAGREREVAIRGAIGGSRTRLVRQFLTESVLLAGLGGSVGVLVGWQLLLAMNRWIPRFLLPAEADVRLDARVLLFAAAIAVATGILFGIAPAVHGVRADLVGSLKEGGRAATSGSGRKQIRNTLVVAEIALAFVLLSGAGLLLRSFYQLQQVNPGFDSTNVITMELPLSLQQYPDGPRIVGYQQQVIEKIQAVPGVRSVAVANALPLEGWADGMHFQIEGRPFVDPSNRPDCGFKTASPTYLSAVGLRLLRGRWLAEADTAATIPVAVINETMAKQNFQGQDPLGQRILIDQLIPGQPAVGPEIPWQVVGVVADEKIHRLDESSAGLYVSYKQSPSLGTALVVRAAMDPARLVKSIQSAVWQIDSSQAFDDIKTLERIKADSLGENRLRQVWAKAVVSVMMIR